MLKSPLMMFLGMTWVKLSKRNMDALVTVNFSSIIDFSAEGGVRVEEIEHIGNIDSTEKQTLDSHKLELNKISVRLIKKQKEFLTFHFLSLKETYFLKGEKIFNREYANINGLGRSTKKVLIISFKTY
tara:strand:- start:209 stop:592 length:384 start_codon:yes stop_codon:yes gene_type:complete